jgi:predicted ferric reductase
MKYVYWGIFWVVVYLVIALAPQFVLLIGPVPAGNGFWWDFSISLGFAGAAMLCMMFFLTARFRRASAPFGIDLIYYFHRHISLVAFLIIIAHLAILLVLEPDFLGMLAPTPANWPYLSGAGSVIVLALLLIASLWRKQLSIHYDGWRLWHGILATLALILAFLHIEGIGNYIASPWKRTLWTIILISWLLLLGYVRLLKPWNMLKRPFTVERITREKGDAWTLELRSKGHKGFPFMPGQFAWLTLWDSPFALKEHPFSISSSAKHPDRIGFTIKELGDFTKRMQHVRPEQVAYLDGPYGSFSIDRHPASGCFHSRRHRYRSDTRHAPHP